MVCTTPSCTVPILKVSFAGLLQTTTTDRENWKTGNIDDLERPNRHHSHKISAPEGRPIDASWPSSIVLAKSLAKVNTIAPCHVFRPFLRGYSTESIFHGPHHPHPSKLHSATLQPPTSVRGLGLGSGQPWLSATLRFCFGACEAMADEDRKSRLGLLHSKRHQW